MAVTAISAVKEGEIQKSTFKSKDAQETDFGVLMELLGGTILGLNPDENKHTGDSLLANSLLLAQQGPLDAATAIEVSRGKLVAIGEQLDTGSVIQTSNGELVSIPGELDSGTLTGKGSVQTVMAILKDSTDFGLTLAQSVEGPKNVPEISQQKSEGLLNNASTDQLMAATGDKTETILYAKVVERVLGGEKDQSVVNAQGMSITGKGIKLDTKGNEAIVGKLALNQDVLPVSPAVHNPSPSGYTPNKESNSTSYYSDNKFTNDGSSIIEALPGTSQTNSANMDKTEALPGLHLVPDSLEAGEELNRYLRQEVALVIRNTVHEYRYVDTPKLKSFEVKLSPEQLGNITIKVSLEDGRLNTSFIVADSKVGNLLTGQLGELREVLVNQGLILGQMDVNVQQNFNQGSSSRQFELNRRASLKDEEVVPNEYGYPAEQSKVLDVLA